MTTFKIFPAIKKSIRIAFKHKMLWVFAIMISGYSAGANFNMLTGSNKSDDTSKGNVNMDQQAPKKVSFNSSKLLAVNSVVSEDSDSTMPQEIVPLDFESDSLENNINMDELPPVSSGQTSNETLDTSFNKFVFLQAVQILTLTPVEELLPIFRSNIIVLSIIAFIGITIALIVGLLVRAWGLIALLFGAKKAIDETELKLKYISETGVSYAAKMVHFQILIFVTFFLVTFMFGIFGVSPFVFFSGYSITFLLLFVVIVFYLLFLVSLIYISKFGQYFIVFEGKKPADAFYAGWDFFKVNIKPIILTDLASLLLISLVMGALISIASVLFYFGVYLYPAVMVFMQENLALIVPLSLFVGIISITLALALMAFTGFMVTFKYILRTELFFALNSGLDSSNIDSTNQKFDLHDSNRMEVANVA